jgi:hypothetical protein
MLDLPARGLLQGANFSPNIIAVVAAKRKVKKVKNALLRVKYQKKSIVLDGNFILYNVTLISGGLEKLECKDAYLVFSVKFDVPPVA